MHSSFPLLLARLIRDSGKSKQQFAEEARIAPSTLSNLLRGRGHPPSTDVCLRIADVAHAVASEVLEAGGRSDALEVIQRLFGAANTLAATEMLVIEQLRMLPKEEARAWALVLSRTAEAVKHSRAPARGVPFRSR
jgi:transcriptional regulator with XRE-family HTH domain